MINAELIHNPYLLQTTVRFNGIEPRINSQIEKYEGENLHLWAQKIPAIFRDEMNGYDFDLLFTGTVNDCNEIRKAFADAGVSPEEVRIFHKNELESVERKSEEIDALISWLRKHPNRKFDAHTFLATHAELFEHVYPCVMIGEAAPSDGETIVSPESVQSYEELEKTVLRHTPILFIIDDQSKANFRDNLLHILPREDVQQNQLFFLIAPYLNADQIRRVICDLGVETPQIISSVDDQSILRYVHNYPMTEYVRYVIALLEKTTADIDETLKAENKNSAAANVAVYEELDKLDRTIDSLKAADESFTEGDNLRRPRAFNAAVETFRTEIGKWRNRRTKVTGDDEIDVAAKEYDAQLCHCFENFKQELRTVFADRIGEIQKDLHRKYTTQNLEIGYKPAGDVPVPVEVPFDSLRTAFLELKQESFENSDKTFFARLGLDKPAEPREPVRVVTCYYEHWRDKAAELLLPVAEKMVNDSTELLQQYYVQLSELYHQHLLQLIEKQTEKRNETANQLSKEEKQLQEDNNWLQRFRDQLTHIERG